MRRKLFLILSILFIGVSTIVLQGQAPQQQNPVQAQPEGTIECHNFVKDDQKPNCACWGRPNTDNPQNPECKPLGEDPRCTNHCKAHMCKCKLKCQS